MGKSESAVMCPGVAIVFGVPAVACGCYTTFSVGEQSSLRTLRRPDGTQPTPTATGTVGATTVAVASYWLQSRTVLKLPVFQEGGLWAAPSSISTWTQFWKATGPKVPCPLLIAPRDRAAGCSKHLRTGWILHGRRGL